MTAALFEPAEGIAAGRCLAARTLNATRPVTNQHPRTCAWCDWPLDNLRAAVESFNAWIDHRRRSYAYSEVSTWDELADVEQERLIVAAQGLAEDPPAPPPEPMAAPTSPPAREEESNPWMP